MPWSLAARWQQGGRQAKPFADNPNRVLHPQTLATQLATDVVVLFDLAGDDGIIEAHLDVEGRGDHLVEFFSDMTARFLLVIDQED